MWVNKRTWFRSYHLISDIRLNEKRLRTFIGKWKCAINMSEEGKKILKKTKQNN